MSLFTDFDFLRDLERKVVEAEMDLTLAKSQGFLKDHLLRNGSLSTKKLLAVIGVYTGFGSHLRRKIFRESWMPKGLFSSFNGEREVITDIYLKHYDFKLPHFI